MSSGWRVPVIGLVAAVVALASAGAASADNNNNNSNTNDVTSIGNPSLGNTSGSEKTNWPPTDLGWPPKEIMSSGSSETNGNKGNESSAATPIVMPVGQPAATPTAEPSTTETPKPIVPVNSP